MLAYPDTTVRITLAEPIALEPAFGGIGRALIKPKVGECKTIAISNLGEELRALSSPNKITIKWLNDDSNAVYESYIELVSRHYFNLDTLRNFNKGVDGFDDESLYTEDALFFARQAATDVFEQAAKRSFVHRIGRTKDYGRDKLINLEHGDVYELISDGYIQVSDSQLERTCIGRAFPFFIEYYYGADEMPLEVSRAVLELAAYILRPTNRPIGATGESTDAGYIHFTTAGRDGATSIPEVNAAIDQFGRGVQCVW